MVGTWSVSLYLKRLPAMIEMLGPTLNELLKTTKETLVKNKGWAHSALGGGGEGNVCFTSVCSFGVRRARPWLTCLT